MTVRSYRIGEAARRAGLSVRRLRFYADRGLLPPSGRTASGQRVFTDGDLVRLGLIRALREAGIGLDAIRDVLADRASTAEALKLRLAEIEAQIDRHRRLAATLRAALRSPEPGSPDNLRRILTMTELTAAECNAAIVRFLEGVADDPEVDPRWVRRTAHLSELALPDEPETAQIDAWIELRALMRDPDFVRTMRENARDTYADPMDAALLDAEMKTHFAEARAAMEAGLAPDSETSRAIARRSLESWARALKVEPDSEYWARMRRKHLVHKEATERYWALVAAIGGRLRDNTRRDAVGVWIGRATNALLSEA